MNSYELVPISLSTDREDTMSATRKRTPLTDEEKYKVLKQYSEGLSNDENAKSVSRDTRSVKTFIQATLRAMNTIKETNILAMKPTSTQLAARGTQPTKFLTPKFLKHLENNAEIYAYYFVQTGDNKFSLQAAGLDIGIANNLPKATKDYVYRIRGQFIRQLPDIASYVKSEQDKMMAHLDVEKPHVQRELLNQIEELKILCVDDPRQRTNLLKAIEMLGKTVTAFTDSVHVEETNAKTGLEILMKRVKEEQGAVYEQEQEEESEAGG